jgi:hypothetical protein
MWLAIWFPQLSYDCADHNQIRQDVSLCQLGCFHALWNETLSWQYHVFYASKKCAHFITNQLSHYLR